MPENAKNLGVRHLSFSAMGSLCQLWFYHGTEQNIFRAFSACKAEALRFERVYSRYLSDSIIGRLNLGVPVTVTKELAALLHYADVAYRQSEGLFDITSGVLRRAWQFRTGRLPTQALIDQLLPAVGWQRVIEENNIESDDQHQPLQPNRFEKNEFLLPAGMEIDLGGIVKEYAADALAQLARAHGIVNGLIDLAGDIYAIGPLPNGQPWRVNIRHPRKSDTALAQLKLSCGAIASSGDYERYMIINNRRYCHILNPKTGWPVQGISAVSVVAPLCVIAGTMATTAMLLGPEKAQAYLSASGLSYVLEPVSVSVAAEI